MQLFAALSLASLALATASAPEKVVLRGLSKGNTAKRAASPLALFSRQAGTCPVATTECSDGVSCCPFGNECCLDGCCDVLFSCDPQMTMGKPCVCYGFGCPDGDDSDDGSDVTSSFSPLPSATRLSSLSVVSSLPDATTTSALSGDDDDDSAPAATTSATARDSNSIASGAASPTSGGGSGSSGSNSGSSGSSSEGMASGSRRVGIELVALGTVAAAFGFAAVML